MESDKFFIYQRIMDYLSHNIKGDSIMVVYQNHTYYHSTMSEIDIPVKENLLRIQIMGKYMKNK